MEVELNQKIEKTQIDTEEYKIQLEELKLKGKKLDDEVAGSKSLTEKVKKDLEDTENDYNTE